MSKVFLYKTTDIEDRDCSKNIQPIYDKLKSKEN